MDENKLQERANQLKQQFDEINKNINDIVTEANSQLTQLGEQIKNIKSEAQQKVEQLTLQLEQVRGAYTEITYILHPELQQKQTHTEIDNNTNSEEVTVSTMDDNTTENKSTDKQSDENSVTVSGLTVEEMNKIKSVTSHKNKKQEDIPDYLQEEYNK